MTQKIILGSDHAGHELKEKVKEILEENNRINIRISASCIIPRDKLAKAISTDRRFLPDPRDPEILTFKPANAPVEKKLSDVKKWLQQFIQAD